MRVAYIVDPVQRLNATTDSTVELLRCHAQRGDEIFIVYRNGISLADSKLHLSAAKITLSDDDSNWYKLDSFNPLDLSSIDLIALRLEPPVDSSFRIICQLLSHAKNQNVVVVNDPASVLAREEKLSALNYPELCPKTLVSSNREALLDFANQLENGCMLKPLDSFGGKGVFAFNHGDTNLAVAIEQALANDNTLVIQERLKEIKDGDRRVFVIDGKAYPIMLNRVPKSGSHLGNMIAGGQAKAIELGDAEQNIVNTIGPDLAKAGIVFAGIDVIGDKLTEINITCPTGLRTVRDQLNKHPAHDICEAYASLVNSNNN